MHLTLTIVVVVCWCALLIDIDATVAAFVVVPHHHHASTKVSTSGCCCNHHAVFSSSLYATAGVNNDPKEDADDAVLLETKAAALPSTKATLTSATTWQLRIALRNVATTQGRRLENVMFVVLGQFVEQDGYEPPQGTFQQEKMQKQLNQDDAQPQQLLSIVKSRWILSEDPNDRKDGLWIWGLFKEPLYPFMLLQLETDVIALPNDSIAPLQLYAQVNHNSKQQRVMGNQETNALLLLDAVTDLKIRKAETIQADPFGVSQVDVYEEVSIGSLSIQAVDTSDKI